MKSYEIHDNCGRPFLVNVHEKNRQVEIYKSDSIISDSDDEQDNKQNNKKSCETYDVLVKTITYEHIFIGVGDDMGDNGYKEDDIIGNSILVQINKQKYMYIGSTIFSFSTQDEIIDYFSPIGQNDIPFPYAIGKTYTYLMAEKKYIHNEKLKVEDPYTQYYNHDMKYSKFTKFFKDLHTEQIHGRECIIF